MIALPLVLPPFTPVISVLLCDPMVLRYYAVDLIVKWLLCIVQQIGKAVETESPMPPSDAY